MQLAVVEESWLFEAPLGISDGRGVRVHGPWEPAACSRQLLAWFDAGLLQLYADAPADAPRPTNRAEWQIWNEGQFLRALEPAAARDLLAHPERWTSATEDGFVRLCAS